MPLNQRVLDGMGSGEVGAFAGNTSTDTATRSLPSGVLCLLSIRYQRPLAKRFEGFHRVPKSDPGRAPPYVCPAGFWTIGYGHLCDPTHPPIAVAEGRAYLARDLLTALDATLRFCLVLATQPEGRLAAIVDFTCNLGAGRLQTSTLRRRVNQQDWIAVGQELRRWVYGGGKVLPGLVSRRAAEVALLLRNA